MKNKITIGSRGSKLALIYAHGDRELKLTEDAIIETFKVYKKAVNKGCDKFLNGSAIKPVFRKYN